ncbi:MAG TPA: hypothetical protein DIU07_13000 [Rhodobacteraceae bacterium]|nr:hypothetical protein [Paracoccaceae bacterium]
MRANLIMNGDIQIGFGLMPAARDDEIAPGMRLVFLAILPHMIRAVVLQWRIHRLEMKHAAARSSGHASGVLVVNSDGRILLADPAAEAILANGASLVVRHGILHAREAHDSDTLHRLI